MASADRERLAGESACPTLAVQCDCCEEIARHNRFGCACMRKILCQACNHCLDHCKCDGTPEATLPYPMQVSDIRAWWARQGLAV